MNALSRADENVKMLANLKETKEYLELENLYKTGIEPVKHTNLSGAIKGKSNILNNLRELIEGAEKEIVICTSVSELNEKSRVFSSLFNTLQKRKINTKVALSGDEQEIKRINSKFKINAQKLEINSQFFIADKEKILFMLSQPNSAKDEEEVGVWINSPFFVNSLAYLFEQAWKR